MIIKSSNHQNTYFTYLLTSNHRSRGTVILLDGIPGKPTSKEELMRVLVNKGFDVFFPRYEGTWESEGEFLKVKPSQAITNFLNEIKTGIQLEGRKYESVKLFILATSFGGAIALDIASENIVNKICVVSPVISFSKVIGITTLEKHLNSTYPNEYRFSTKNWQRLIQDELWNLDNNEIKNNKDILIILGKNDDQIQEIDILNFAKEKNIKTTIYDSGHITLSKITEQMSQEIVDFFSK